jgi:hypothetical protein
MSDIPPKQCHLFSDPESEEDPNAWTRFPPLEPGPIQALPVSANLNQWFVPLPAVPQLSPTQRAKRNLLVAQKISVQSKINSEQRTFNNAKRQRELYEERINSRCHSRSEMRCLQPILDSWIAASEISHEKLSKLEWDLYGITEDIWRVEQGLEYSE